MNNEIEKIQRELGLFLIEIMPVEWKKICLYAECEDGYNSFWGCFQESKTDLIVTTEFFYDRYKHYAYTEHEIHRALADFLFDLYDAYKKEFGKDKIWNTMTFIIYSNKKFEIDFGYDTPDDTLNGSIAQRKALTRKYFGKEYGYTNEKYPYEITANDPFYSQENMERLKRSAAQMEQTGGTIHEIGALPNND